jgi:hypothetical protein
MAVSRVRSKVAALLLLSSVANMGNAIPPPNPVGVLWVFPGKPSSGNCNATAIVSYPIPNVQYWLNGKSLWRIRVTKSAVRITRLKFPLHEGGVSEAERTADAANPLTFDCSLRGEFELKYLAKPGSIEALFPQTSIGRMRQIQGVWYWARK